MKDIERLVFEQILEVLIVALDDYTTDNRGDVGSWVREKSLVALSSINENTINCFICKGCFLFIKKVINSQNQANVKLNIL